MTTTRALYWAVVCVALATSQIDHDTVIPEDDTVIELAQGSGVYAGTQDCAFATITDQQTCERCAGATWTSSGQCNQEGNVYTGPSSSNFVTQAATIDCTSVATQAACTSCLGQLATFSAPQCVATPSPTPSPTMAASAAVSPSVGQAYQQWLDSQPASGSELAQAAPTIACSIAQFEAPVSITDSGTCASCGYTWHAAQCALRDSSTTDSVCVGDCS